MSHVPLAVGTPERGRFGVYTYIWWVDIVFTWCSHGVHMVFTWCSHGVHMIFTLLTWSFRRVAACTPQTPESLYCKPFSKVSVLLNSLSQMALEGSFSEISLEYVLPYTIQVTHPPPLHPPLSPTGNSHFTKVSALLRT